MKIAIRQEIASPESSFIASVLDGADVLHPWTPSTEVYDIAVCVGPVSSCPPAKKRILFVLGQTASHKDFDWDCVVVTSNKARKLALRKFGHGVRVVKLSPPVLNLNAGKRRLVTEKRGLMHASEVATHPTHAIRMLNLWGVLPAPNNNNGWAMHPWAYPIGRPEYWYQWVGAKAKNVREAPSISLFKALEFNSLVRGGAIGFYPNWMEDGYDIQVRRHLALGGRVFCRPDNEIIGDCADLVDEMMVASCRLVDLDMRKPTVFEETEVQYADSIKEIIGLVRK